MKATVSVRLRDGRWNIRIRAAGRKELSEYLPGDIPKQAIEAKAAQYRYKIGIENWDPWSERVMSKLDDVRISHAVKLYIEYLDTSPNHTPNSRRTASYRMKKVAKLYGDLQLNDIKSRHLAKLVDSAGPSSATRKSFGSGLRAFLNWCKAQGYVDEVPKLRLPKASRKTKQEITEDEVLDIVAACLRHYAKNPVKCAQFRTFANMWLVQFHTGLRNSELVNLRVRDYLPSKRFQIGSVGRDTKTHSDRWVPVPETVQGIVEAFAQNQSPSSLLFGDVNADRYSRVFKKFLIEVLPERADELSVYSLRHSYAIRLLNSKINGHMAYTDYEVANLLGHSTQTLHNNYAEFSFDRMMGDFQERYTAISRTQLRLVTVLKDE